MGTRHSEYREDPLGWYVEHPDVSIALFDQLDALGLGLEVLHDPSCGQGNIVDVALARAIEATGADIVDRAAGRFAVRDFLQDTRAYRNIVCNPPYKRAVEFIRHGLAHVLPGGRVIMLAQLSFLASQERHSLFDQYCSHVFAFSQRPSIPPGEELRRHGEAIRGSGSRDYVWAAFDPRHAPGSGAVTHWLKPKPRLTVRAGKLSYAAFGIRPKQARTTRPASLAPAGRTIGQADVVIETEIPASRILPRGGSWVQRARAGRGGGAEGPGGRPAPR